MKKRQKRYTTRKDIDAIADLNMLKRATQGNSKAH